MARFFKPKKKDLNSLIDKPLSVESLSDDGRGLAHHRGKAVFIDGALPEELVNVRVLSETSRYLDAKATKISNASPNRVEPRCNYANQCGGCSLQHMDYSTQRDYKEKHLFAQLAHNSLYPKPLPTLYNNAFGYRHRLRLGVNVNKNGDITLGFRAKQSQQLVDIKSCLVGASHLTRLIEPLRNWLQNLANAPVTHIELVGHDKNNAVVIRHNRKINAEAKQNLVKQLAELSCQTWFQSKKQGELEDEDGKTVTPRLAYRLAPYDITLQYHPQDFIQANVDLNTKMVEQALSLLKPQADEHFADLFCGIGNFSLPLARLAASVHGFEGVQSMVDRATANARLNELNNAHFSQADLGALDASVYDMPRIDGLLLDPPRSGAKLVCEQIKRIYPKRLVYISCNPATFNRDAQILCANNYRLTASGLVDMFPQTSHSEVIGMFEL